MFSVERIVSIGPHEFRRSVQRLMIAMGYAAFSVDGPNDHGADLVCEVNGEIWVLQTKWKKSGGRISAEVVEELITAREFYAAHQAIIVSNGVLEKAAGKRLTALSGRGLGVGWWGLDTLQQLVDKTIPVSSVSINLRDYQKSAKTSVIDDLKNKGSALLYLATGLGKTVVAGSVIEHYFREEKVKRILVLAHMTELIEQLQKSLWPFLDISVHSQLLDNNNKPDVFDGLTIATNLSALSVVEAGYRPDLIVIDECHHVGFDNTYSSILKICEGIPFLGVTATPWRGDGFDIETVFGAPSATCDMAEGIRKGYLSKVNYKLFCDNIDWEIVPELSEQDYSIKQLNKKLFIPQRDEQICDAILEAFNTVIKPKCVVFCQSIEHATQLFNRLRSVSKFKNARLLHSELSLSDRRKALLDFRGDGCPILLAVDILNEGVDIPSVNIVCFARVTHSRKIFIQQLGRGLRIADEKEFVLVLDFAADIRRTAAIKNLKNAIDDPREAPGGIEILESYRSKIVFSDQKAEQLIDEWIRDAANLETANDEAMLNFPQV